MNELSPWLPNEIEALNKLVGEVDYRSGIQEIFLSSDLRAIADAELGDVDVAAGLRDVFFNGKVRSSLDREIGEMDVEAGLDEILFSPDPHDATSRNLGVDGDGNLTADAEQHASDIGSVGNSLWDASTDLRILIGSRGLAFFLRELATSPILDAGNFLAPSYSPSSERGPDSAEQRRLHRALRQEFEKRVVESTTRLRVHLSALEAASAGELRVLRSRRQDLSLVRDLALNIARTATSGAALSRNEWDELTRRLVIRVNVFRRDVSQTKNSAHVFDTIKVVTDATADISQSTIMLAAVDGLRAEFRVDLPSIELVSSASGGSEPSTEVLELIRLAFSTLIRQQFGASGASAFTDHFLSEMHTSPYILRQAVARSALAAVTDARDADLTRIGHVAIEDLHQVVWSDQTTWPEGLESIVRNSSRSIDGRPGEHIIETRGPSSRHHRYVPSR